MTPTTTLGAEDAATPQWPGVRELLKPSDVRYGTRDRATWRIVLRNTGGVIGLAILAVLGFLALFANQLYPGDPMQTVATPLLAPFQDAAYPFGTDSLGRDVTAGLVHGARTSLAVGFSAAAIGLGVGILLGSIAGYFGGWVEKAVLRVTELFQATPMFLFIVVVVALFQPSADVIAAAIGFTTWETIARIVRAEFRQLLQSDFVIAARTVGHGNWRIIVHEILPNVLPSIVVLSSFKVATAIFMESGLAFLGLGDPNTVSWGAMINEGRDFIRSAWYLTVAPGAAIVATVLALNLLGDALNDALNPRLRKVA